MQDFEEIFKIIPLELVKLLKNQDEMLKEGIQEIRFRMNQPVAIKTQIREYLLIDSYYEWIANKQQLKETVEKLSGYSMYAFEEELRQGYITIVGGHRVGFCGRAVLENGRVKTLRQVSSINIRVAMQVVGCGEKWVKYLYEGNKLCHTIIVSPPGCGKTTLLRDFVRILSSGGEGRKPYTIGVVDERGEIAAMKNGVSQMDLGPRTDVQENCPKAEGMVFLLRSMTPEVIAVDELGRDEDFFGVESLLHAGVTLISTVHGNSMEGLLQNEKMHRMIRDMGEGRFIFLSGRDGTGTVETIWDNHGKKHYERGVTS